MILIVEDDEICRKALQILLRAKGYLCVGVSSAEQALGFLDGQPEPDMLLVDIDLPGMNGLDLVKTIQHHFPSIPCTLMSANDYELAARECSRRVPFLAKPLDLNKLMAMVGTAQPV